MEWLDLIKELALAIITGIILGTFSYRLGQRDVGVRVFTLICVAAVLTTRVSLGIGVNESGPWAGDPARLSAQLISALGFLGVGMIWFWQNKVKGLSSYALLWVAAVLSILIGMGLYREGIASLVIISFVLALMEIRKRTME